MRPEAAAVTGPACVLVAVPVGRDAWASRQATLHYAGSRLVLAEGIDLPNAGPNGLTGTLYVVRDKFWRDRRRVLRVERQQVVDGRVVSAQNWGEVEDAGAAAA
jgi:hypothetical protein